MDSSVDQQTSANASHMEDTTNTVSCGGPERLADLIVHNQGTFDVASGLDHPDRMRLGGVCRDLRDRIPPVYVIGVKSLTGIRDDAGALLAATTSNSPSIEDLDDIDSDGEYTWGPEVDKALAEANAEASKRAREYYDDMVYRHLCTLGTYMRAQPFEKLIINPYRDLGSCYDPLVSVTSRARTNRASTPSTRKPVPDWSDIQFKKIRIVLPRVQDHSDRLPGSREMAFLKAANARAQDNLSLAVPSNATGTSVWTPYMLTNIAACMRDATTRSSRIEVNLVGPFRPVSWLNVRESTYDPFKTYNAPDIKPNSSVLAIYMAEDQQTCEAKAPGPEMARQLVQSSFMMGGTPIVAIFPENWRPKPNPDGSSYSLNDLQNDVHAMTSDYWISKDPKLSPGRVFIRTCGRPTEIIHQKSDCPHPSE